MLRLVFQTEPVWIDLHDGVEVLVRPFTSAVCAAARHAVETDHADLASMGERFVALCSEIAQIAIIDWRGVAGADDQPLPITRDGILALMSIWLLNIAFAQKYVTPGLTMAVEKKGFAPSLNGTSGVAQNIAVDVTPAAPTVPIQ